jgi:hypothetical protein
VGDRGVKEQFTFEDLKGQTLVSVTRQGEDDALIFTLADGRVFHMYHRDDCCESVTIESIVGDLADLVGEVLFADESCNRECGPREEYDSSYTWTFYRIGTIKGSCVIRWFGTSNGYYSEEVDFEEQAA